MSQQIATANNKLRKRNIHRVTGESNQTESGSMSARVGDNEPRNSFMKSLVPKSLRQRFARGKKNPTQNKLVTGKGKKSGTVIESSSDSDLSSTCARLSDGDVKNNDVDDTSDATPLHVSYNTCTTVSSNSDSSNLDSEYNYETSDNAFSFLTFRLSYLFVTLVVMLADGLQGKTLGSKIYHFSKAFDVITFTH